METPAFFEAFLQWDRRATDRVLLPANRVWLREIAKLLAHSGDVYVCGAVLVALWFLGGRSWQAPALALATGLVVAEVAVMIVKAILRRPRPQGDWGRIYRRLDPFSFPSGHAARAMMLCLLTFRMFPWWVFAIVLAWSPFMVWSRVALGIHYVSDALGGFVLGLGITWGVIGLSAWILAILPRLAP